MNFVELRNDALKSLRKNLAELEACKLDDYVLAYNDGLAIRFDEDANFAPRVTTLDRATCVGKTGMPEEAWAYTPIVKNGNNEQAKVVHRQSAIAREAVKLREMIEGLEQLNRVNG